jgi:hypothetical protein
MVEPLIVSVVLLGLGVFGNFCAFRAGEHRALARMYGVLIDALQDLPEDASATEYATRIRQLAEARGLHSRRKSPPTTSPRR